MCTKISIFCLHLQIALFFKGGFFVCYVLNSTLLYLPSLRFICVGGCWDRTPDSCDYGIDCQAL
jgi:hypothetical protein